MGGNLTRFYSSSKRIENVNIYVPNLQNLSNYQKLRCYTGNTPVLTYNKRYLFNEKVSVYDDIHKESRKNILENSGDFASEFGNRKQANLDKLLDYLKFIAEEHQKKKAQLDIDRYLDSLTKVHEMVADSKEAKDKNVKVIYENSSPRSNSDPMIVIQPTFVVRDEPTNNTSLKEYADKLLKTYLITNVIVFLAGKVQSIVKSIPNIFSKF